MTKSILQMTPEERVAIRQANPPEVHGIHQGNAYFDWGWKGCGHGQLSFTFDPEGDKITCMNECMGRDSVRKILHAFADFVADRVILEDTSEDVPPVNLAAERAQARKEYEEWAKENERWTKKHGHKE